MKKTKQIVASNKLEQNLNVKRNQADIFHCSDAFENFINTDIVRQNSKRKTKDKERKSEHRKNLQQRKYRQQMEFVRSMWDSFESIKQSEKF